MVLLDSINAPAISNEFPSKGGNALLNIRGDDFTGVTLDVEMSTEHDPRWATIPDGQFTDNTSIKLDYLPAGVLLRINAAGVGAADNITVEIFQ